MRICEVCREIEKRAQENDNHYANQGRPKKRGEYTEPEEEITSSIAQDAIARLERMLAGA